MARKPAADDADASEGGGKPMKLRKEFQTDAFMAGLRIRRAVLGKEYVDKSVHYVSDFMADFQKLTTEVAWGQIWGREGLERKTRSMLNIAMLTALNRPHELKLHLRGALTNGVTRDEIKEILLQTCIYCGIPAGLESFRIAVELFKEIDEANPA
jgi:4-carboxymuconolactone decarboxylase